jgi:molybdopterin molybdotransferase
MISFDEAQRIILARAVRGARTVRIPVTEAVGFVLAERIVSEIDMPPFNKAAMDGFAFRHADAVPGAEMRVVGTVAAGDHPTVKLGSGECVTIMTGAAVPADADTVIPVEDTSVERLSPTEKIERVRFRRIPDRSMHIAPHGEDMRRGDVALEEGVLVNHQEVAILATLGRTEVQVHGAPTIAFAATGEELVTPGTLLGSGQIYNSNAYTLESQIRRAGGVPHPLGVIRDDADDLREKIGAGLNTDLLLLSGGVSMGKYDLVPGVLQELGVEIIFHKLRVKPAKPVLFGMRGETMVFGLPGNPVSTLYAFDLYVAPAIRCYQHHPEPGTRRYSGTLTAPVTNKTDRMLLLPCVWSWTEGTYQLAPISTHGSADIFAISGANAVAMIPAGAASVPQGRQACFLKLYE